MAPVKIFQVRTNYAPWLSSDMKVMMKERDQAQQIASESKNPEDWEKYKSLRNKVNNKSKVEKKLWQTQKLNECCRDTSSDYVVFLARNSISGKVEINPHFAVIQSNP